MEIPPCSEAIRKRKLLKISKDSRGDNESNSSGVSASSMPLPSPRGHGEESKGFHKPGAEKKLKVSKSKLRSNAKTNQIPSTVPSKLSRPKPELPKKQISLTDIKLYKNTRVSSKQENKNLEKPKDKPPRDRYAKAHFSAKLPPIGRSVSCTLGRGIDSSSSLKARGMNNGTKTTPNSSPRLPRPPKAKAEGIQSQNQQEKKIIQSKSAPATPRKLVKVKAKACQIPTAGSVTPDTPESARSDVSKGKKYRSNLGLGRERPGSGLTSQNLKDMIDSLTNSRAELSNQDVEIVPSPNQYFTTVNLQKSVQQFIESTNFNYLEDYATKLAMDASFYQEEDMVLESSPENQYEVERMEVSDPVEIIGCVDSQVGLANRSTSTKSEQPGELVTRDSDKLVKSELEVFDPQAEEVSEDLNSLTNEAESSEETVTVSPRSPGDELLEQMKSYILESRFSCSDQELFLRMDVLTKMLQLPDQFNSKEVLTLLESLPPVKSPRSDSNSNQDSGNDGQNGMLEFHGVPVEPIPPGLNLHVMNTFKEVRAIRVIIEKELEELKRNFSSSSDFSPERLADRESDPLSPRSFINDLPEEPQVEMTASRSEFIREIENELREVDSCAEWISNNLLTDLADEIEEFDGREVTLPMPSTLKDESVRIQLPEHCVSEIFRIQKDIVKPEIIGDTINLDLEILKLESESQSEIVAEEFESDFVSSPAVMVETMMSSTPSKHKDNEKQTLVTGLSSFVYKEEDFPTLDEANLLFEESAPLLDFDYSYEGFEPWLELELNDPIDIWASDSEEVEHEIEDELTTTVLSQFSKNLKVPEKDVHILNVKSGLDDLDLDFTLEDDSLDELKVVEYPLEEGTEPNSGSDNQGHEVGLKRSGTYVVSTGNYFVDPPGIRRTNTYVISSGIKWPSYTPGVSEDSQNFEDTDSNWLQVAPEPMYDSPRLLDAEEDEWIWSDCKSKSESGEAIEEFCNEEPNFSKTASENLQPIQTEEGDEEGRDYDVLKNFKSEIHISESRLDDQAFKELDYRNSKLWGRVKIGSRKLREERSNYVQTKALYTPVLPEPSSSHVSIVSNSVSAQVSSNPRTDDSDQENESPERKSLELKIKIKTEPPKDISRYKVARGIDVTLSRKRSVIPKVAVDLIKDITKPKRNSHQNEEDQAITEVLVRTPNLSRFYRFRKWIQRVLFTPVSRIFQRN